MYNRYVMLPRMVGAGPCLPSNSFLQSIACPIFPHSGIPFDIFQQNKRGVANAEEYSFYLGLILQFAQISPFILG
jgi:hypothetical protein